MRDHPHLYIDGSWVEPAGNERMSVINPATEAVCGSVAMGTAEDVDRAVKAARRAFAQWSQSSRVERLNLLKAIQSVYSRRQGDLADAIVEELGAPTSLAQGFQVELGAGHLATTIEVLEAFEFEKERGSTLITHEPIGVCGLITPWNWAMSLICVKVFPALATGCTVVLKPAENSPFSAHILTEILDEAGVPSGVFNMIQGSGRIVGHAIASHPDVDLVSFTGSEAVGVEVAKAAAPSVKRVCQELGGKGANIVLDDEDLAANVAAATTGMMVNSGQTCSAGSRLLVPVSRLKEAVEAACAAASAVSVGDPRSDVMMGPVVSERQFNSIQQHIHDAINEGAELVCGGLGRPEGLKAGWYVRPTIFVASNDAKISRTEVFGPVLVLIAYNDLDDAVSIANDSDYGLAAYVNGRDAEVCRAVAKRIRVGWVSINNGFDFHAPFGGFKKSGNGREWGEAGFQEYLEIRSLLGYSQLKNA